VDNSKEKVLNNLIEFEIDKNNDELFETIGEHSNKKEIIDHH